MCSTLSASTIAVASIPATTSTAETIRRRRSESRIEGRRIVAKTLHTDRRFGNLGREMGHDHAAGGLAEDEVDRAAEELLVGAAGQPALVRRADHDELGIVLDRRVDHQPAGVPRPADDRAI